MSVHKFLEVSVWSPYAKFKKKTDVVNTSKAGNHKSLLICYCLQLESDMWTSTFASHLNTSGKAGGCRQEY